MSDFINADVDIGKFNTLIAIMRRNSVNTRPVMAAVGNLVVKSVRQNFREEGRPDKWVPSVLPRLIKSPYKIKGPYKGIEAVYPYFCVDKI